MVETFNLLHVGSEWRTEKTVILGGHSSVSSLCQCSARRGTKQTELRMCDDVVFSEPFRIDILVVFWYHQRLVSKTFRKLHMYHNHVFVFVVVWNASFFCMGGFCVKDDATWNSTFRGVSPDVLLQEHEV